MRSVFEIRQDGTPIFRGRMTDDTKDFYNVKMVDIEGVMAYFNDTVIRPFIFPDDFTSDAAYTEAATSGNVVEYFLAWLIDTHNAQAKDFQRFKLGNVTVADPNNYLARSDSGYKSTWEILKTKLFESALGGYLCIRYEEDGNYIDYLADFELTNTQRIIFGENLLDLSQESDASETYTAVIPLGAKMNEIDEASEDDSRLTIAELPDGFITEDLVKEGDMIYSHEAVEKYGFICAPVEETTWEDVTVAENLQTNAKEYLVGEGMRLLNTTTIKAVDLHFSDEEIQSFRIYRYVAVESKPHNHSGRYLLSKIEGDIENPQNTTFTIGDTSLTLTDINAANKQNSNQQIESIIVQSKKEATDITEIQNTIVEQSSSIITTCEEVIIAALEKYVETSNYAEFTETVMAQFQLLSDEINLNFTTLTQDIVNVNGDLQEKFNTITKYFTFSVNGLTIGQTDNPHKVVIDNDRYSMLVNDMEVLWIADGEVNTPELTVTDRFKLFGYAIEQDENGNVNCEYIGGGF